MINLEVKDLRRDYIFVIRVYGKELLKVNSQQQLKGVIKALHCIGVNSKDIHAYKVNVRKVEI